MAKTAKTHERSSGVPKHSFVTKSGIKSKSRQSIGAISSKINHRQSLSQSLRLWDSQSQGLCERFPKLRLWKNTITDYWMIIVVLILSFLLRAIYISFPTEVWWDAATYMAMGKYIYTLGHAGFFEIERPLVWPLILGFFWKINASMVWAGRIIELLLSTASIFMVYLIGSRIFNKKTGIIAAILFSFSPLYFQHTNVELTEIPSTFFALIAVYLAVLAFDKNRNKESGKNIKKTKQDFDARLLAVSGIFAGIAFMTRFPQGGIIAAMLIAMAAYFLVRKNIHSGIVACLLFFIGVMISVLPYLIYNQTAYGSAVWPFIKATIVVTTFARWMNLEYGSAFYLLNLLKDNFLFIFSMAGLLFLGINAKKEKDMLAGRLIVLFPIFIIFAYFTNMELKTLRFMILLLPYLAIYSAYGLTECLALLQGAFTVNSAGGVDSVNNETAKTRRSAGKNIREIDYLFFALFLFLIVSSMLAVLPFIRDAKLQKMNDYFMFFENEQVKDRGILLITNPGFAPYIDNRMEPFIWWDMADRAYDMYYNESFAISIRTCDYECQALDFKCLADREKFLSRVRNSNKLIYYKNGTSEFGVCEYFIYETIRENSAEKSISGIYEPAREEKETAESQKTSYVVVS